VAAKQGFVVDTYADDAVGVMSKNEAGRMWVSKVTLAPAIIFVGEKRPTPQQLDELHHLAHDECYIANSVKSEVVVEGSMSFA
jgi:organic hydroperoxide reductase OsmC/OhrA